jgi:tetratricopeptide (TPR) repeat protein
MLGALYINWARTHKAMGDLPAALAKANRAFSIWSDLKYRFPMGSALLELAHCRVASGELDQADRDYTRSIALIEEDVAATGYNQWSQGELRNAYVGRARTRERLGQRASASKDWERALELADDKERPIARAEILIQAGRVAEAVSVVAELTKLNTWESAHWYNFACMYAIASRKDVAKRALYSARAVELLQKAIDKGWTNFELLKQDPDLEPLRNYQDFQKLVSGLEKRQSAPTGGSR